VGVECIAFRPREDEEETAIRAACITIGEREVRVTTNMGQDMH
jgi:hypothetical protein